MSTKEVTDQDFEKEVAEGFTLVDFWAPWCTPCRLVSPLVDEIAEEMKETLKVVKMNTDENPVTAPKLGIQGIPTLILFKDGQFVDRLVGAHPKENIMGFVTKGMQS